MSTQVQIREYLHSYRYFIGITAAVSIIWQQVYHRLFCVPKNLRHIPAIAFLQQIRALLKWEPVSSRTKRLVFPLLSKANGVYLNRMPFVWTVYVANPILAKAVLSRPELANKNSVLSTLSEDSPFLQFVGMDNVSITNGDQWKKQRKVMNTVFRRLLPVDVLGHLMPKVFQIVDKKQAKGEEISGLDLMKRLTMEALGASLFGFDFGCLDNENSVWVETYTQFLDSCFESTFLFPRIDALLRKFNRGRRERYNATFKLIDIVNDMVERRRVAMQESKVISKEIPESEKDLLTLMLEIELGGGEETWSKEELLNNIRTLIFAGHDTTANSLTFVLYNLAIHKDVQDKARSEVLSLLGDEPIDVFPASEDIKKMPYIDMIIKETLRVYPPANDLLARVASKDINLGGVFIPKGTLVSVDFYALHHNPKLWRDPELFIPERFAENGEHSTHEGVTWAPFSGGSRQCAAINFSMGEQRIFLSMLLRKYEWELPAGSIHQNGLAMDQAFQNVAPLSLTFQFKKRY